MMPTFTVELEGDLVILRSATNPEVFTTIFTDVASTRRLTQFLEAFAEVQEIVDAEPSEAEMDAYAEQARGIEARNAQPEAP